MAATDKDEVAMEGVLSSIELNGNGHHGTTIGSVKVSPFVSSLGALPPKLPYAGFGKSMKFTKRSLFARHQSNQRTQGTSPRAEPHAMNTNTPALAAVQVRIPPGPRFPPLPYSSKKTGLVYDIRMRFHSEFPDLQSSQDDIHPEDPRRIYEIYNEIHQAGLVHDAEDPEEDTHDEQCWRIHPRPATAAEICLIHTLEHYKFIESLQDQPVSVLRELSDSHDSIYFNNATFGCAMLAAGGAIEACRAVVRGDVRNAIAIIRPPGHHAESNAASGFCIFNNVPIATRVCQKDFPEKCRKVLILDWDVHHGNGVQHAFYDDPNVLYISLHVFKGGTFYPNLPDANYNYCGNGPGLGRNVNIPWAEHGMGDAEYLYAFQEVVMPIATEFDPDLVIISAGFDAAEGDVLGGCHVTPACYAHMTHMLMRIASGKIAVCLEGGYNLRSIARSALAVTRTLMLQPPDRLGDNLEPKESAVRIIEQVKREQSKYWKCLYPKEIDSSDATFHATKRLHEVIEEWQRHSMADRHRMTPLAINKLSIAKTFEHNVIATPDFMEQHPLLVIFHDPPAIRTKPDPITGKTEPHSMWLTNTITKGYIGWAVENGFEVIDVNIPNVVSVEDDDGGYVNEHGYESRLFQTKKLAAYLWENYIEPHYATQVFFMGIGSGYTGLLDMLSRYENCTEEGSIVQSLIGFVADTPLQSIKRPTDDNIGNWYYQHSMLFVQRSHLVWDPERNHKRRRKWGNLIRSEKDELEDMLSYHQRDVQDQLLRMKSEYEEQVQQASAGDHQQQGLSRTQSPRQPETTNAAKIPKLPPMGFFTVSTKSPRLGTSSPRSPASPLKSDFRKG